MQDDGIGVYVVEQLSKGDFLSNFRFAVGETDIDYCLDVIDEEDYLVIIDAANTGSEPGDIKLDVEGNLLGSNRSGHSTGTSFIFAKFSSIVI